MTPNDAAWRLLEFEIHHSNPSVERLPCHLPFDNSIVTPRRIISNKYWITQGIMSPSSLNGFKQTDQFLLLNSSLMPSSRSTLLGMRMGNVGDPVKVIRKGLEE